MRYGHILILLFIFQAARAQSDLQTINQYTTREGLSNNTVFCMLQDSRGFLWLGTKEGLNRFDGFQFKKYFFEKNNPRSLPHDNIFDILEYRFGQLLIATSNGLGVLNTLTGQFENEKISTVSLRAGSGTNINSMYRDKQANIWINHDGELDILDSNLVYLYRFTDLDWAKNLKGVLIRFEHWYSDRQGRLWLPSDTSGIHVIDFTAKKVYNSRNNPQQLPYLKSQSIRAFLNDEVNHILWYAPWGEGLISYNFSTGLLHQQLFGIKEKGESRTINSMIKTGEGKLLCFMSNRCYEIDNATLEYKIAEKSSFNNPGNNIITSLAVHEADNDQYWIGSSQGLYRLGERNTSYKELSLIKPGSSSEECTDMMLTRSGRLYCTYTNNRLVVLEKNGNEPAYYLLPGHTNTILTQVCEDRLNRIWIGSDKGVFLFDPVKKIFTRPDFLPDELLRFNINHIYCDNDGEVWIATRGPFGLYHFDGHNNQIQKANNSIIAHFETLGESSRISAITEDNQGHLWMSSKLGGGIIYYEKKKDEWKLYPPSGRNFNFLSNKGLVSLFAGDDHFLWLSSQFGDGLIRYDYKNDSILQFTRHDGLLNNNVLNIIADNHKNLWLTTENGVTKFNPVTMKSEQSISFTEPATVNQHIVSDSLSSTLVVSLNDRLLFIPASSNPITNSYPRPVIDKITVNNLEQFINPQNHQLTLHHDQKNIAIDFTAVALLSNSPIHFAYRLTGVDKDWIYPNASRTAQYSILAPGNYSFQLKAGNESGNWNPDMVNFSFSIASPWWKTTWFRVAASLIIIGLVSLLFRKRVSSIRHEAAMKQKIAETEMMALRAQMNPHFIFNCINSIDALIQSNDKYNATVYLNKFAKLIRNILDSSKLNTVTLAKDLETLQLYIDLEQLRNENKFTAEIRTDESLLQDDFKVPPLIIQPYVENAILHGLRNRTDNLGKLSVFVHRKNGHIQYIIKDNGVGRHAAGNGKQNDKESYGMQMSKERVQLFNNEETASVKITDLHNPTGTKVEVLLIMQ